MGCKYMSVKLQVFLVMIFLQPTLSDTSGRVCKWDQTTTTCNQDSIALTSLLSESQTDIAYMIRCQYAYDNDTCMNMQPASCVWESDACHISARYLVDTLIDCAANKETVQEKGNRESFEKCVESLEFVRDEYTWLDTNYSYGVREECAAFFSESGAAYDLDAQCEFFYGLNDCEKSDEQSNSLLCNKQGGNLNQQLIGQQLLQDVRYFLYGGDPESQEQLLLPQLESVLGINNNNLMMYQQCSQHTTESTCESTNSSKQQLGHQQKKNRDIDRSEEYEDSGIGNTPIYVISVGGSFMLLMLCAMMSQFFCSCSKREGVQTTSVQDDVTTPLPSPFNSRQLVPHVPSVDTSLIVDMLPDVEFELQGEGSESEVLCAICLEEFHEGEQTTVFACKHQFHFECAEEWIRAKGKIVFCPLCKHELADDCKKNQP
eukprot:TRINITY_DN179_c0_g1_i1.p1 TRINITY_DN179_c0_g1~~TRINITY_DN179_c0_g1_i1.p1  ORF type:complete len:431 (-),score=36.75 TRINITY_DN179_c0_g1_i1:480-1772(-)